LWVFLKNSSGKYFDLTVRNQEDMRETYMCVLSYIVFTKYIYDEPVRLDVMASNVA